MTSMQAPISAPPPPPPPVPPLPPLPRRTRRTPIVAAIVAGAVAGGLAFTGTAVWAARDGADHTASAAAVGTSYDSSYDSTTDYGDAESTTSGWTSTEEDVVLTLIEARPEFADYDSACVLGVIEDHFAALDDFALASETDSSEITSTAYDVMGEC